MTATPWPWQRTEASRSLRAWTALTHAGTMVIEQAAFEPPYAPQIREFGFAASDIRYPPEHVRAVVEYLPGTQTPIVAYKALAGEGVPLTASANTLAVVVRDAWKHHNRTRKRTLFGRAASR